VVSLAVELSGGFRVGNVKLEREDASALGTKEDANAFRVLGGGLVGCSSVTLLPGERFLSTLA
jgi:hypothetical protein